MLDLSTSQTLSYTFNGVTYTIVVYADTAVATNSTYYIVPQPVVATGQNGQPSFSLLQIESGGNVTGQCNFQSVLITPPGSVAYVQQHFTPSPGAPPINVGAWGWTGGVVYFNYAYPVNGQSTPFTAVAFPSLMPTTVVGQQSQATGTAAFSISLPTQAAVQAFVAAFGPQGAGNSFSLDYQMQVPGSLPGVTCTVAFDSSIAYQYQQSISVSTNVWGDVTSETITINQYLNQSEAGSITYEWGAIDPQSALGQQVQNWANQTLQNDVQQAVNNAIALMSQNQPSGNSYTFSMSQVSSFSTVYSSNQVVTWFAECESTLPSFSDAQWSQIFQTINTAPLTVVCSLQNAGLAALGISSVTMSISSPSGNGQGTLTDASSTWTFSVPAVLSGSQPNFTYTYFYTVQYTNTQSWQSQPVTQNASTSPFVTLNPGALGALAVAFQTTNVPYGTGANQVNYVQVNFTFTNTNTPAGVPAQTVTQSQQFFANNVPWNVQFPTALPYNTTYMYGVTYVMANGTQITLAPQFGNANNVFLASPLMNRTFLCLPQWGSGTSAISNIIVQASYVDPDNQVSVQDNLWNLASSSSANTPWMFQAPQNPNAYADIVLAQFNNTAGNVVTYPVPWFVPNAAINISGTQTPYMVTIDPSLIDWTQVSNVLINMYLLNSSNQMLQQNSKQFVNGVGPYYYAFMVTNASSLTWYFNLQYIPVGGSAVNIPQQSYTGQILLLPRTYTTSDLMANVQPFHSLETHGRELEIRRGRLFRGANDLARVAGASKDRKAGPPLHVS